jgi:polyisoprenoid-binding protein YceI
VWAVVVAALPLALSVASAVWAEPKTYVVVPAKSRVMFEASFPLGNFTGVTHEVWGEVRLDPATFARGVQGSAGINPASLKTGIDGRDRDLRITLEVDRYPEIRFTLHEVRASFPSLADRADTYLTLEGELSIHGVARSVTLTGRAQLRDGQVWVRGEGTLNMTDYGIRPPKKFFLSVGDQVRVSFDTLLAPRE